MNKHNLQSRNITILKQTCDGGSITVPQLVVTFCLGLYFPSSYSQHAKKVVSDSPGLVDFAIGLVNSVINLPDRQVKFWGKLRLQKNCNQCSSKNFFG